MCEVLLNIPESDDKLDPCVNGYSAHHGKYGGGTIGVFQKAYCLANIP